MRQCLSCKAALPTDYLDVYCQVPCLDQLYECLADKLVESRAREMAAAHWVRSTWWAMHWPRRAAS
jgi:hypothetical protein